MRNSPKRPQGQRAHTARVQTYTPWIMGRLGRGDWYNPRIPGFLYLCPGSETCTRAQFSSLGLCLRAIGIISPPLPHRKHPQTTDLVGVHPEPPQQQQHRPRTAPRATTIKPAPKGHSSGLSASVLLWNGSAACKGTLRSTRQACDHQLNPASQL